MKKFLITVSDDVTEDELRTLFFDWLLPDTFEQFSIQEVVGLKTIGDSR